MPETQATSQRRQSGHRVRGCGLPKGVVGRQILVGVPWQHAHDLLRVYVYLHIYIYFFFFCVFLFGGEGLVLGFSGISAVLVEGVGGGLRARDFGRRA